MKVTPIFGQQILFTTKKENKTTADNKNISNITQKPLSQVSFSGFPFRHSASSDETYDRAMTLYKEKNYGKAIKTFKKALTSYQNESEINNKKIARGFNFLANSYLLYGSDSKAEENYKKSISSYQKILPENLVGLADYDKPFKLSSVKWEELEADQRNACTELGYVMHNLARLNHTQARRLMYYKLDEPGPIYERSFLIFNKLKNLDNQEKTDNTRLHQEFNKIKYNLDLFRQERPEYNKRLDEWPDHMCDLAHDSVEDRPIEVALTSWNKPIKY